MIIKKNWEFSYNLLDFITIKMLQYFFIMLVSQWNEIYDVAYRKTKLVNSVTPIGYVKINTSCLSSTIYLNKCGHL